MLPKCADNTQNTFNIVLKELPPRVIRTSGQICWLSLQEVQQDGTLNWLEVRYGRTFCMQHGKMTERLNAVTFVVLYMQLAVKCCTVITTFQLFFFPLHLQPQHSYQQDADISWLE